MNKINFSHHYPKLWGQERAELLAIRLLDAFVVDKNEDLIEYDTKYYIENPTVNDFPYEHYSLPKTGKLIQLIFIGNKEIPFCTLRRYTLEKYKYYQNLIGNIFEIKIEAEK